MRTVSPTTAPTMFMLNVLNILVAKEIIDSRHNIIVTDHPYTPIFKRYILLFTIIYEQAAKNRP